MKLISHTLRYSLPFLGLLAAASAQAADSASTELTIKGVAQPVCRMPDPSAISGSNSSISNKTITVDNLISPEDATVKAWEATLTFSGVMCNYAAYVSLRSQNGGMKLVGDAIQPVGGTFLNHVDYVAVAKWGSVPDLQLDTATAGTTPVQLQTAGANQADLTVRIATPASNTPLVQGTFQDTLIVRVGPSL